MLSQICSPRGGHALLCFLCQDANSSFEFNMHKHCVHVHHIIRHEKLCFCCVCRIASAHATKDGDESDETSKDDDWANEKKGMPVANYTASLIEI